MGSLESCQRFIWRMWCPTYTVPKIHHFLDRVVNEQVKWSWLLVKLHPRFLSYFTLITILLLWWTSTGPYIKYVTNWIRIRFVRQRSDPTLDQTNNYLKSVIYSSPPNLYIRTLGWRIGGGADHHQLRDVKAQQPQHNNFSSTWLMALCVLHTLMKFRPKDAK